MPFKEGAEVKEGDLLFEIDPRPYQAQYDQAEGQVNLYKAQLELAKANYARDKEVAKTPGAVSLQQLDQDKAAVDEADAAVKAFQASLEVYKLNLEFHQGHLADRRPGQPLLSDARQPGHPGPDVADHGRLAGPDVRLFRRGRGHAARVRRAINEGKIKRYQRGRNARLDGAGRAKRGSRTKGPSISSTTR